MEQIKSTARIAILMATYRGEKYLRNQIDSIIGQTCHDWTLYIHDDGSTDGTLSVIKEYVKQYPDRIVLLEYPSQGGACRNFLSMLERVKADYYMFADQDDVWHPDKIEKSMDVLLAAERQHPSRPVFVHADLCVIDENGHVLHDSFFQYAGIRPERMVKYEDYIHTLVTGSTMLFNHQVKEACFRRPQTDATMHDAWITLRAIAEGGIRCTISEPLVDYRQHSGNVLGAEDGNRFTLGYRLSHAQDMVKKNLQHFRMMKSAGEMNLYMYLKKKYIFFRKK